MFLKNVVSKVLSVCNDSVYTDWPERRQGVRNRRWVIISPGLAKPKDIIAGHLLTLRLYVKKVVLEGKELSFREDADRVARLKEFVSIGLACRCTYKDLVTLLYADVFQTKRGCDCYSCKRRRMLGDARNSPL